jgi:hypothetical protein
MIAETQYTDVVFHSCVNFVCFLFIFGCDLGRPVIYEGKIDLEGTIKHLSCRTWGLSPPLDDLWHFGFIYTLVKENITLHVQASLIA